MSFFNDDEQNVEAPAKPEGVPEEAFWEAQDNEWAIGEKNADGNSIGEWKWWRTDGTLVCHTIYEGEDGGNFSFTRYHEDGTPSMQGQYRNNLMDGETISTKSENPTTERFNPRVECWKAVTTFDADRGGAVVEEHYFDQDGNECAEPFIS